MIRGLAFAKVNFGLRVGSRREDGFHPVSGIFQSIDITDDIVLEVADADDIGTSGGGPVPDGTDNLAWRAVAEVRSHAGSAQPLRVTLDKGIPTAAGLGGGSADAAAGLGFAGRYFGVALADLAGIAPRLGSDVPFCLRGGTARVSGRGEVVEPLDLLSGFAVGVVVPPVELSTPQVFARWDEMGEPQGMQMAEGQLPPGLRGDAMVNDLYPAAASLHPGLDDWRADLEQAWGRQVVLSGSGPSLYGFFVDEDEAQAAVTAIPNGARFAAACLPVSSGWRITSE